MCRIFGTSRTVVEFPENHKRNSHISGVFRERLNCILPSAKNPDADVFAAGVIPAEDFSEIPLQELEQTKDDETAGNETVTRGGSVQNEQEKHEMDYIVNVNTGKFHYPDCRGVKQMKESNKRYVTCDRQELLNQGYESCGMCRP